MTHTNSFFLQHLRIYTMWPIHREKIVFTSTIMWRIWCLLSMYMRNKMSGSGSRVWSNPITTHWDMHHIVWHKGTISDNVMPPSWKQNIITLSTVKTEATGSSKTPVLIYQNTWHHMPDLNTTLGKLKCYGTVSVSSSRKISLNHSNVSLYWRPAHPKQNRTEDFS